MINQLISSFNAGELSPYLETRTNLEKYRNGCRVLENFLLTPYGPANRRAGLEYRGAAKLPSKYCRLIGLNLTAISRVVLELGDGYMRFWKDGNLITSAGVPVEATATDWEGNVISPQPARQHPYTESQLQDVRHCQVNNVIYFVHPSYPPYRLSRFSDTDWRMGEIPWSWVPTLDQNVTTTTITPSAKTGTITLTASSSIFLAGHVDSFWELDHATDKGILNYSITANATSSSLAVLGKWQLQSFGTWSADIQLQASSDGGSTWETRRTYVSRKDSNIVSNGEETQETLLRFVVTEWTSVASDPAARIQLSAIDPLLKGYVRITSVTNGTTATALVVKPLASTTATSMWYEGAFSAVQGYPNAVSLHESRLIFGGTSSSPNTLWGSYSNDFQNFRKGAFDSDSWVFTLASTTGGRVQWLVSKSALLIGTSLDEWSLSASDQTRPLTSTNVRAQNQSNYGSTNLPALIINDTILYVQRMARKVRELIYTFASESWVSNDLTALAEHTTRTLIQEVAYQRVPDAVYWFIRGDGQLVSMTYEREQQVVGFARHNTDGLFESVATINGLDGEDEVWVSVRRVVNGSVTRYIERFKLGMREALDTGDKTAWFFVDSGVQVTPTYSNFAPVSTTTITGLSHLEGKDVSVWAGVFNQVVDAGPSLTLSSIQKTAGAVNPIKLTTSTPHNAAVGKTVVVSGLLTSGGNVSVLNGTYAVAAIPSATELWYYIPTNTTTALSTLYGTSTCKIASNEITYGIVESAINVNTGLPMVVTGGSLTMQTPVCAWVVGLPYTSLLCPERVDQQLTDGTSQSRKMRIPRINVKLYQSFAGEYSSDQVTWFPMVARKLTDYMDDSPPVLNGWTRMYLSSNWADGVDIYVRQNLPIPLTVAAIVPVWEVTEGQN
jgi:hypothetical protein